MSEHIETLRRAEARIRHDVDFGQADGSAVVLSNVADWLRTAGADIWAHGPLCECRTGCDACDDNLWEPHARAALAVARAYLGESS